MPFLSSHLPKTTPSSTSDSASPLTAVTVHTDGQSDQLNQALQAKAFTTGQDIFFQAGAYEPGSQAGQELLAHELTHVVQQGQTTINRQESEEPTPQILEEIEEEGGAYLKAQTSSLQQPTIQRAYTARRPLGGETELWPRQSIC